MFVDIWCELQRDILDHLHRRLSRCLGVVNTFVKLVRAESGCYANNSLPTSPHVPLTQTLTVRRASWSILERENVSTVKRFRGKLLEAK